VLGAELGAIRTNGFPSQSERARTGVRRSCQLADRSGQPWTPDRHLRRNPRSSLL